MGDQPADPIDVLRQEIASLRAQLGAVAPDPAAARRAAVLERVNSLCARYTGDSSQGVAQHSISTPAELSHFANNPVPRPPMATRPGEPYPIGDTAWGQALASSLGAGSAYFQELSTWGPLASYLFDATGTLYQLLAAPDFDAAHREALAGLAECFNAISDGALCAIHVHSLRARHGAAVATAFQTQLRLEGAHPAAVPERVVSFDKAIADKLITAHQKQAASAAARGILGSSTSGQRGRRGGRGNRGNQFSGGSHRGRGRSAGGASGASD